MLDDMSKDPSNSPQLKSPDDKSRIFINELNSIYSTLFQEDAKTSGLGLVTLARMSLKKLLDDYHANYAADPFGRNQADTIALYFRLMNSISRYSNDHFKQTAYDVYTSHMHAYRNDANYVHLIANNMFAMRNAGALSPDAQINHEKLLGLSDEMVWQEIRKYAESEFESYGWALKYTDRSRALDELKVGLKKINSSAEPANVKIAKFIAELQEASTLAAKSDFDEDKKKSRWNIFSYRNVEGSRFQNMLTEIQDKATSFAVVMPDNKLPNEKSITYLKKLLMKLVERTDLVKVRKQPVISQIHDDALLKSAIERLPNAVEQLDTKQLNHAYRDLLIIQQRLKAYAKNLTASIRITSDSSLSAYASFTNDIIVKLEKFQFAQETQELASGTRKGNFYTSGAYTLRQNIQTRIEMLLRDDYVAAEDNGSQKFADVLSGNDDSVNLARSVLLEMETSLKLQYPRVKAIELGEVSVANDTLSAGFKLTTKNNETFNVPLVVNSLTRVAGKKDFMFVELPVIKGATIAPVRHMHIVASGVLKALPILRKPVLEVSIASPALKNNK